MILLNIEVLNIKSKNIAAGKHNFSVVDRCSIGCSCVCSCVCICACSCVASDVRPDTICFGCIFRYFARPKTDRITTTIIVRNANFLILFRICSPINLFSYVHRIISKTAFGFKEISARYGLKGQFRVAGGRTSGFIGQRRKIFLNLLSIFRCLVSAYICGGGEKD